MPNSKTLFEIVGVPKRAIDWNKASLVLINFQREFESGDLALGEKGYASVGNALELLKLSRSHDVPVFFVMYRSVPATGIFDSDGEGVKLLSGFDPEDNEEVITTNSQNAFCNTSLNELLTLTNREQLLIAGFMSHLSILATAQAADDLGYENFVFFDACWTRPLTGHGGDQLSAETVHEVSMAAIRDCYASVVTVPDLAGK